MSVQNSSSYSNEITSLYFLDVNSPFSYQCRRCSQCCRNRHVLMNPYDVICLAHTLQISTGQFIQQFLLLSQEGAFLRHRLNGDCIFLEKNDCLVYQDRPLSCRLYPLQQVPSSGKNLFSKLELPLGSAGIYGKNGTVAQYLNRQEAQYWMDATDVYTDLLMRLYEKMQLEESPSSVAELMQNVTRFMAIILDADVMIDALQQQSCPPTDTEKKMQAHVKAIETLIEGGIDTSQLVKRSQVSQFAKTPSCRGLDRAINYIVWPFITPSVNSKTFEYNGMLAVPDGRGATTLDVLQQLDKTQWWSAEKLARHQIIQIRQLLKHFKETSPFYRSRLEEAGVDDIENITFANFHQLPILTRSDFQNAGESLFSTAPPSDHGHITSITTSGSTGTPVTIRCTALSDGVHWATFIRNDIWHNRDFNKKFAYILSYRDLDYAKYPTADVLDAWNESFNTGPLVILNVSTATLEQQLEWLIRERPAYLMSFPSNLAGLARLCIKKAERLSSLENISTIGEQLSPAQRQVMQDAWGIPVCETYGCTEATYIAFQHPDRKQLLVQSECVYAEILDENNQPCEVGQVGRVVITTLHNFVTPVIRYEVGDLAVWGEQDKERGLPVINEVLGRSRDAIRLPNGEKGFPLRWGEDIGRLAPVRQWQLIQKSYTDMEIRLAVERPLSNEEENAIIKAFKRVLGHEYRFVTRYVKEIPRAVSGKYKEFRCDIPD